MAEHFTRFTRKIGELLAKNIARTAVTVKWAMREMLLAIFCRAKTFLYLIGGLTIDY